MKYKVKHLRFASWLNEYEVCELELERYEFQSVLAGLMESPNRHVLDVTEVE